jgi:hypothetical protein
MRLAELTPLGTKAPTKVRSPNAREGNVSRTSEPPVKAVSDEEARALLDRYRCPVPFHAVRTRFLRKIASQSCQHPAPLNRLPGPRTLVNR